MAETLYQSERDFLMEQLIGAGYDETTTLDTLRRAFYAKAESQGLAGIGVYVPKDIAPVSLTVRRATMRQTITATDHIAGEPWFFDAGSPNGLGSVTRWKIPVACDDVRVRFDNNDCYAKGIGNPIYVKGMIRSVAENVWRPLTFNGKPFIRIEHKHGTFHDYADLSCPAGDIVEVCCFAWVEKDGYSIPVNQSRSVVAGVGDIWFGADLVFDASSDIANDVSMTDLGGSDDSAAGSFAPTSVYGIPIAETGRVAAIGDSILGCAISSQDQTTTAIGLVAYGKDAPVFVLSHPGGTVDICIDSEILDTLHGAETVVVQYGTNNLADFYNFRSGVYSDWILNRLRTVWAILKARGHKVYQASLLPNNKLNGQFDAATFETTDGCQTETYAGYSDWVLALNEAFSDAVDSGELDGVIDWTTPVTVIDGDGMLKWRNGMVKSTDCVHPNKSGVRVMATAVDPTIFGLPAKYVHNSHGAMIVVENKDDIVDVSGLSLSVSTPEGKIPAIVEPTGGVTRRVRNLTGGACEILGSSTKPLVSANQDFAFTVWCKLSSTPTGQSFVVGRPVAGNGTTHTVFTTLSNAVGGRFVTVYKDQTFAAELFASTERAGFTTDIWHCVGLSFNMETGTKSVSIFYDNATGAAWDNQALSNQAWTIAFQDLVVGGSPVLNQSVVGLFGEVQFFDRKLSRTEFAQYFTNTKSEYGL